MIGIDVRVRAEVNFFVAFWVDNSNLVLSVLAQATKEHGSLSTWYILPLADGPLSGGYPK